MTTTAWILVWKGLFIIGLIIYAIISCWVMVQGFKDIKFLLQKLKKTNK